MLTKRIYRNASAILGATIIFSQFGTVSPLQADTNAYLEPSLDRWMYPFNQTPGTRSAASTFGAVGETDFDDRDGQFLVGFDTSPLIPSGLGTSTYSITSVKLTFTINLNNTFTYDNSYDGWQTYLPDTDPNYLADSDPGRPVELHGVDYRNGYDKSTFIESSPFGTSDSRNAYAMGFDAAGDSRDVSNNVENTFESTPWAIGQTSDVNPGATVPEDSVFTFTLDLSSPEVKNYLQQGLDDGELRFMITSLHPATQTGSATFVSFYTRDNILHDPDFGDYLAAQLEIDYTAVPEPSALALLFISVMAFITRRNHHTGPN